MILTDFTFKDTGITVKIRKISPMLAVDIAAAIPEPDPPISEVNYGEPKGIVKEGNKSDPDYQKAMVEHRGKVFRAFRRAMVLRGVFLESLPDSWQTDAQEYRSFMEKQTGQPVDEPDDMVLYILRIAVGTEEDLEELITAITRRSQPTQEVIEQAKSSFQVKYKGRDLWTWKVESSHITYSQELHWRMAAKWNNLTWKKFIKLEGDEQSRLVATYETALQMEAVQATDVNRKARKPGKGRS